MIEVAPDVRHDVPQDVQPLPTDPELEVRESGRIAARVSETGDKTTSERVGKVCEHDRDRAGFLQECGGGGSAGCHNHIRVKLNQFFCKLLYAGGIASGKTTFKANVQSVLPPRGLQSASKR